MIKKCTAPKQAYFLVQMMSLTMLKQMFSNLQKRYKSKRREYRQKILLVAILVLFLETI